VRPRQLIRKVPWLKFLGLLSLIFFVLFAGITMFWWFSPSTWESDLEQHIVIVPKVIDVNTNHILFIKYDKVSNNISMNSIPALEEVELRGGYGTYPLKSLFPLLTLDRHEARTIRAAYSYALDTSIDQVWASSTDEVFAAKSLAELSAYIVSRDIHASLSLRDRIEVSQEMRKYPLERQEYATLDAWRSTASTRYNTDFRTCRVGVTNASQTSGLAGNIERIVNRVGGIVIRIDAQSSQEHTKIFVQPGQSACKELIRHLTVLSPEIIEVIEDDTVFSRVRSELEFVIGDDLAKYLKD
jgi:hypothetical protein